jgi:hypothetical protein
MNTSSFTLPGTALADFKDALDGFAIEVASQNFAGSFFGPRT